LPAFKRLLEARGDFLLLGAVYKFSLLLLLLLLLLDLMTETFLMNVYRFCWRHFSVRAYMYLRLSYNADSIIIM